MKNEKKYSLWLAIVILLIAPFFINSFFCNPVADDFSFAYQMKYSHYFSLVYETYLYWSGRYTSNALIYLTPISENKFGAYQLFAFLNIGAIVCAFYVLINQIANKLSSKWKLIVGVGFTLLYLTNLPSISEQVYWYTGSVVYHWSVISFLLLATTCISILQTEQKTKQIILFVIGIILSIITAGFNEVTSIIILVLMGFFSFGLFRQKAKNRGKIMSLFIVMLICLLIMVFAPGNKIRQAAYTNAHDVFHSTKYAFAQTIRFIVLWLINPAFIIITILYILFWQKIMCYCNALIRSIRINRWITLSMLVFVVFIASFAPYWSTGILGQHRTMNVAWFFFLLLWFVNLTSWLRYKSLEISIHKKYKNWLYVLVIIALIGSGNGKIVMLDLLSGKAQLYKKQLDDRHALLIESKDNSIELKAIKSMPKSLFIIDITEDPKNWINESYALYFEKPKGSINLKN